MRTLTSSRTIDGGPGGGESRAVVEIHAGIESASPERRQAHGCLADSGTSACQRFPEGILDDSGQRSVGLSRNLLRLGQQVIRDVHGGTHASKRITDAS